jgi:hypothetical protein
MMINDLQLQDICASLIASSLHDDYCLGNIVIGDHAIIGSGSLVLKPIPDGNNSTPSIKKPTSSIELFIKISIKNPSSN